MIVDLETLVPGIGRYTAGAIASIAYNIKTPIVDGNITRVISRLRSLNSDSKSKQSIHQQWLLAEQLVDCERPGEFNQALMELGALVCTSRNPECMKCPIEKHCIVKRRVYRRQ